MPCFLLPNGIRLRRTLSGLTLSLALLLLWATLPPAELWAQSKGIGVTAAGRGAGATERRLALVVGNSDYAVSPLRNPANDAKDLAEALRGVGFEVTLLLNGDQGQMKRAIDDFGIALREGGVGLFYYSGHGMQVGGRNYMIPVGARIDAERMVEYNAVDAGRVLGNMEVAGNGMNILILDACRNNPFARSFRSAAQGLATMDAPQGTFISYATAPGTVAADGDGRNSPYTRALIQHLATPGLKLEDVFKRVRAGVLKDSSGRQVPWEASSLTGDFFFMGKPRGQEDQAGQSLAIPARTLNAEEEYWITIKNSRYSDDFQAYLNDYPEGRFARIAALRIRQLQRQSEPAAVSAPVQIPAPQPGGRSLVVDSAGGGDARTIREAMERAGPGTTIQIRPGTYREALVMDRELHLVGMGERDAVILEASDADCLLFKTDRGSVRNMTLRYVGGGKYYCVDVTKGRLELEGNDITSNGLAAVAVHDEADPIVRDNVIHHGASSGLFVYEQGRGTYERNTIHANAKSGVSVAEESNPILRSNRVHGNGAAGIFIYKDATGRYEDNDIYGNKFSGLEIKSGANPRLAGNRINDNQQAGIWLRKDAGGSIEGNRIFGNRMEGMDVEGGAPFVVGNWVYENGGGNLIRRDGVTGTFRDNKEVSPDGAAVLTNPEPAQGLVVDAQGGGDAETISEAIRRATPGTTIRVRPGIYRENLVLDKELHIVGEGDRKDIVIDASAADCVLFKAQRGSVRGLTLRYSGGGKFYCIDITQGSLELTDNDLTSNGLAVVAIHHGAEPLVRGNHIHDGKSSGVFVYEGGRGRIEKNRITGNANTAIAVSEDSDPQVRGNTLTGGKAGGIYVYEKGRGLFEDNEIADNEGAGFSVSEGADPQVTGNRIHGNSTGVHIYEQGKGRFEKNEIFDNRLTGVIVKEQSDPVFTANRIHGNREAGVWIKDDARGRFEDNHIYENLREGMDVESGAPTVMGNRVYANKAGNIVRRKGAAGTFSANTE